MNDITILISFYERDVTYISDLANKCSEKFKVIVWDDRDDKSYELNFNDKVKVLNSDGENSSIYFARRRLIEAVDTEWLWFVDSDDEPVLDAVDLDKLVADVNIFNYKHYNSESEVISESYEPIFNYGLTDDTYGTDYIDTDIFNYFDSWAVWHKIMRSSVVKEAIKLLPNEKGIYANEDNLLLFAIYKIAKDFKIYVDICIYKWFTYKGRSCLEDYTHNTDRLKSVMRGIGKSIILMESVLDPHDLYLLRYDKWNSVIWYFNKTRKSVYKEERLEMFDALLEELDVVGLKNDFIEDNKQAFPIECKKHLGLSETIEVVVDKSVKMEYKVEYDDVNNCEIWRPVETTLS